MADEQTPILHPANITGSPLVTVGGALLGAGQYLGTQGLTMPHDTQSWVQFGLGLLIAVVTALGRMPAKTVWLLPLLGLLAGQAKALSYMGPGAYGDPISAVCVGCTRATDFPTSSTPTTGMRIPGATGGVVMYRFTVPPEATGPQVGVRIQVMRETILDTDDGVCLDVCMGVVKDGQNVSDLTTRCYSEFAFLEDNWDNDQWDVVQIVGTGLTPKDTTGANCSGTACVNGELYMSVQRLPAASCLIVTGSDDSGLVLDVSPIFQ